LRENTEPHDGDKQEHVVRRLEAFSDIVIGFSLAQTALNLFMPLHPTDFVTRPVGIVGFGITFAVIASFWSAHSAIFRHFFVPNRVMISLNFIALALIVLQVFALQMWLHFGQDRTDGIAAARIYFGVFGITQGLLATLSGLGARYRRLDLSPALLQAGIRRSVGLAFRAIGVLVGVASSSKIVGTFTILAGGERVIAVPNQIFLGLIAGVIVARLVNGFLSRRLPVTS